MGNKRGLSTVVASLIIILLVLVGVGIVWVTIRNIIESSAQEVELSRITTDLDIESVGINENNVNVKIKRGVGQGQITGLKFSIFDGENTFTFDKKNISLKALEAKTYILEYSGIVRRVSVAPIFTLDSGKDSTGNIADTYYVTQQILDNQNESCVPECTNMECGYDGCSGVCGDCTQLYGEGYSCNQGTCTTDACEPDCSLAAETCVGETFSDGCDGVCFGELQPDCTGLLCGGSKNQCGDANSCGVCAEGVCTEGVCAPICETGCAGRQCGPDPNGCQENCGVCGPGEWCNNGTCSVEACTPDCGINNCGPVPNGCGDNCGVCNASIGEFCSEGTCVTETSLNGGVVFSTWPINVGAYFDSEGLPKSGVDYTGSYVKFTTGLETRCLQIREFVTPIEPETYNLSYIRFVTTSTLVNAGDNYEIWQTYEGCII